MLAAALLGAGAALAEPVEFNLPAQSADEALMAFSRQAGVEIFFSFDRLHAKQSSEVKGTMEPEEALGLLLKGTGFEAQPNGKARFVVTAVRLRTGSVRGRLLTPRGTAAGGIHVMVPDTRVTAVTDKLGGFYLDSVPAGNRQIVATGGGFQPLILENVEIVADEVLTLETQAMNAVRDPTLLEPFIVEAKASIPGPLGDGGAPPAPRTAAGNVDMPRTENDALDYEIFTRDQIQRSGVIDLNRFLRRELLNSDATTLPPELNSTTPAFASASTNLNLGGFTAHDDATVVLINGRRLPETVTALPANFSQPSAPQPNVDVVPLNLIDRIEVLPVSASALYSDSPVGGVINIVLRPNVNTTEFTTTYSNATAGYYAPQSTASLLNGETLLGGRLQVRLNITFTQVIPPTEADLGYIRKNLPGVFVPENELYRATPNVASANGSPLFGPGTPSITSVAPGSDGTGGIGAFSGRQGVQSLALYQPIGGGLADSPNSIDFAYGRKEEDSSIYGSVTFDMFPWLQLGVDATARRTVNNTGYGVFTGNLVLPASSAFNPFGQDVDVSLNETAPALRADYDEARIDYYSVVGGMLLRLWGGWEVSADAQYGLNITKFRGIEGVDGGRWQQLVDQGIYNPLRDTQAFAPPQQFYDQALVFFGPKGQFATLGDYDTLDMSLRIANASLALPTGRGAATFGGDYQYGRLSTYTESLRYGDGTLVAAPYFWVGRSLVRYSGFGEVQAPLLPPKWLPSWLLKVEADVSARYTASALANESNLAPTGALKVDLAGGLSLRATYATSNRFPPDYFSHLEVQAAGAQIGGIGQSTGAVIHDPRRGNEPETVQESDAVNPNLQPEAAVTQTLGVIYQRGVVHRFRFSLDFINANTSGEEQYFDAQEVVNLEALLPMRVSRAPAAPGDPYGVGEITTVLSGEFNSAWRHSQNWNASFDYAWTQCAGGTLEAYWRCVYYELYKLEILPNTAPIDELTHPDGATPGLLRQRMNFGANWSGKRLGFGVDGHYFHSRVLPVYDWANQGGDRVAPFWQFDAFVQSDLGRWLPWRSTRYSLRGQLRVDNLLDAGPPKNADDPTGAGVQPYGDWRRRVYSVSATLTF